LYLLDHFKTPSLRPRALNEGITRHPLNKDVEDPILPFIWRGLVEAVDVYGHLNRHLVTVVGSLVRPIDGDVKVAGLGLAESG
jgi:hypothetical protein